MQMFQSSGAFSAVISILFEIAESKNIYGIDESTQIEEPKEQNLDDSWMGCATLVSIRIVRLITTAIKFRPNLTHLRDSIGFHIIHESMNKIGFMHSKYGKKKMFFKTFILSLFIFNKRNL